ncbi:hypothetical protein G6F57_020800 [Rhizopus arrhizus]|nr:hypothetical protein G6F57_020800 [Rhizopus arrhizus]
MEGASNGSALRSRTWPREDGRNWQTEYVQPENGCTLPPARSADRVAKWNWVSGVRLAGFTRQNRPPWLIPTASGPPRTSSHCSPMRARPLSVRNWSLVVMGRVVS